MHGASLRWCDFKLRDFKRSGLHKTWVALPEICAEDQARVHRLGQRHGHVVQFAWRRAVLLHQPCDALLPQLDDPRREGAAIIKTDVLRCLVVAAGVIVVLTGDLGAALVTVGMEAKVYLIPLLILVDIAAVKYCMGSVESVGSRERHKATRPSHRN